MVRNPDRIDMRWLKRLTVEEQEHFGNNWNGANGAMEVIDLHDGNKYKVIIYYTLKQCHLKSNYDTYHNTIT